MKVILENFGPIKRVEFDLTKDLNVIFGENNIGKSYTITALYIILKHLLAEFGGKVERHTRRLWEQSFSGGFYGATIKTNQSTLETLVEEVREAFAKDPYLQEYDITSSLAIALRHVFAVALEEGLSNSFNNSFQSIEQLANNRIDKPLLLTIESKELILSFGAQGNSIVVNRLQLLSSVVAKSHGIKSSSISSNAYRSTLHFRKDVGNKDGYQDDLGMVLGAIGPIIEFFGEQLLGIAHGLYFLPASRSGLYQALNTLSALLADLSRSRSFTTKGFDLPSFSEPVADYFLQLSTIKPTTEQGEVAAIAQQMEQELLGGEVGFNDQTKKLFFRQHSIGQEVELDLSATSSMVSEVAPIVAYFKYVLRRESTTEAYSYSQLLQGMPTTYHLPPSLIFIEEPEAHLHPKVQVKLMEFFARLTKHNVKVIMTSHSNYMFNKLSNLLLQGELEPVKVGSYLMRATPEGSVMDPVAMRAEEEGIMDENFVDVAEQLYNERLAAYDKLNAQQ